MSTSKSLQKQNLTTLQAYLARDDVKASVAALLPKTMKADRLLKIAYQAATRTPKLALCTPVSMVKSCLEAAELGLEPSGLLGQGYLIPYKNKNTGQHEAQFQPGYRGLVSLAIRNGDVTKIDAYAVHEADKFEINYGHDTVSHVPEVIEDPGAFIGAWARATLADGGMKFIFMRRDEINKVKARAKAQGDGPWKTDYQEMAKKTVVKRLCKLLDLSPKTAQVMEFDNMREIGGNTDGLMDIGSLPADASQIGESAPASLTDQDLAELAQAGGRPAEPPKKKGAGAQKGKAATAAKKKAAEGNQPEDPRETAVDVSPATAEEITAVLDAADAANLNTGQVEAYLRKWFQKEAPTDLNATEARQAMMWFIEITKKEGK